MVAVTYEDEYSFMAADGKTVKIPVTQSMPEVLDRPRGR
jgi:hypothetical protein